MVLYTETYLSIKKQVRTVQPTYLACCIFAYTKVVNYNITIQFAYKILTLVALKRWLHAYVTVGKYQVQSLPVDFSVAISLMKLTCLVLYKFQQ